MRSRRLFVALLLGTGVVGAWSWSRHHVAQEKLFSALPESPIKRAIEPTIRRVEVQDPTARSVVDAAKKQIGDEYDASYRTISYPNGDVRKGSGACTDVIVRAFRGANIDLQRLIHDDMKARFRAYPDSWKLGRTDTNIDHRRVPNHIVFFRAYGETLPTQTEGSALKTWQPGDVVEWRLPEGKWHTGVISDGIGPRGLPLVIHNGWRCVEQDCLDGWPISAHFRYPKRGS